MARRATSLTKGCTTTQETASANRTEQATAKAPRRENKPELSDMPPSEMSATDAFFLGGDELVASAAGGGSNEPAKARRGRKSRAIELAAETLTTDDSGAQKATAPTAPVQAAEENQGTDTVAAPDASPSTSLASADAQVASPAARWDASTGTASFDWPVIETVAATAGPNQAIAKLLLAARAEGANSRWPF